MPKITSSTTETFKNGDSVTLEVSNTAMAFRWRLRIGRYFTEWTSHYAGILTIRSQATNCLYAVFMNYWDGTVPTERPVLISTSTE